MDPIDAFLYDAWGWVKAIGTLAGLVAFVVLGIKLQRENDYSDPTRRPKRRSPNHAPEPSPPRGGSASRSPSGSPASPQSPRAGNRDATPADRPSPPMLPGPAARPDDGNHPTDDDAEPPKAAGMLTHTGRRPRR